MKTITGWAVGQGDINEDGKDNEHTVTVMLTNTQICLTPASAKQFATALLLAAENMEKAGEV